MAYILDTLHADPVSAQNAFTSYYQYVEQVGHLMPKEALDFALAPWHYDPRDSRCPHDAWLEQLCIREPSSGERHEVRGIEITLRLLGAFHNGYIELIYSNVFSYSFDNPHEDFIGGHGDWLIDEIRLSERKNVLHEILFFRGTRMVIESTNIFYRWIELGSENT